MNEQVCREFYEVLENLLGDLYLVGLAEISLEDVFAGSGRDAMKVLKRNQQFRAEDKVTLAIGQKLASLETDEGPTGCLDDGDPLSLALRTIPHDRLNEILDA